MAETDDDDTTFPLLRDEYPLFLKAAGQSEKFATKLVEQFLGGGERDHFDGRLCYKLWLQESFPGGLEPSPYDGEFWHSYPERGITCIIEPWNSSALWTGPTSAWWKEFDGRQTAEHRIFGIRPNHDKVVEFLQSAGLLPREDRRLTLTGVAAVGQVGALATEVSPESEASKPQAKGAPRTKKTSIKTRLFDTFDRAPRPIDLKSISKDLNVKLKTVQNRYSDWLKLSRKPAK
jgi:hypothetical protein